MEPRTEVRQNKSPLERPQQIEGAKEVRARKPRFQLVKLEERIAPASYGTGSLHCFNTLACPQ